MYIEYNYPTLQTKPILKEPIYANYILFIFILYSMAIYKHTMCNLANYAPREFSKIQQNFWLT